MAQILVVADESVVREVVVRMLTGAGHDVREACDDASCLNLWRDASADLVVADLAMPQMTGFELISTLRSGGASVPIIGCRAASWSAISNSFARRNQLRVTRLSRSIFLEMQKFSGRLPPLPIDFQQRKSPVFCNL